MNRLVCVLALVLAAAGAAYAAAKPPITARPLGAGQIVASAQVAKSIRLDLAKPADVIFVQAKVMPGASFGWHEHRSAAAVAVVAGTLTLYDRSDPRCTAHPISARQGFVEPPNHVHLARNEGRTPVRLLVAYVGVPHGQSPDVAAVPPERCAAIR